jgi:ABC-type nitrate/sulfonate/bicarbonate transport system substrate-binding protein
MEPLMDKNGLRSSLLVSTRRAFAAGLGALGATAMIRPGHAQARPATLAWTPGPSAPQAALAIERKLWAENGLDMRIVTFPTGREALEAMLGGQVDFALLAELPAVTAAMRNQAFGVLSTLSRYRANRIVINAASGIKGIADLAGRKIGTTLGTNMHFLAEQVLAKAGLRAELVNIAPPDIVPALSRRDVDAAFMFENFLGQARRVLGTNYLEVMTPDYATTFLLTGTRDVLDKRPETASAVVKTFLAANALVAKGEEAQAAVVRATSGALSAEVLRGEWANYQFDMTLDPELLGLMVAQGQWIQRRGLVRTEPTPALFRSFVKEEALKALAPQKVTL